MIASPLACSSAHQRHSDFVASLAADSNRQQNTLCWRRNALLALLVCLLCGCDSGPARVPVSGRVVIDGETLTTGTVVVAPEQDRPAYGKIDSQGRFTLTTDKEGDGCIVGTHRVAVNANEVVGTDLIRQLVPDRYANFAQSGLTVDIKGPTDDLLIELSWEGGRPVEFRLEGDIDPTAQ